MNLCPWEGGRAVAFGYSLNSIITGSTMCSVSNPCSAPSPFNAHIPTDQPEEHIDVIIYPNPSNDYIFIDTDSEIESISLSGILQQVLTSNQSGMNQYILSVQDLPNGLYHLSFINDGVMINKLISIIK